MDKIKVRKTSTVIMATKDWITNTNWMLKRPLVKIVGSTHLMEILYQNEKVSYNSKTDYLVGNDCITPDMEAVIPKNLTGVNIEYVGITVDMKDQYGETFQAAIFTDSEYTKWIAVNTEYRHILESGYTPRLLDAGQGLMIGLFGTNAGNELVGLLQGISRQGTPMYDRMEKLISLWKKESDLAKDKEKRIFKITSSKFLCGICGKRNT